MHSPDATRIDRALVEGAEEALLAWAQYFLLFEQEHLAEMWDDDLTAAVTALHCHLTLAETATRRARHLLTIATHPEERRNG